jgi:hypothetical protein
MKDVIYSLKHVSDQLLLELDLDRCIRHQQRIRYGNLYPLNVLRLLLASILVVNRHRNLLNRRDSLVKRYV